MLGIILHYRELFLGEVFKKFEFKDVFHFKRNEYKHEKLVENFAFYFKTKAIIMQLITLRYHFLYDEYDFGMCDTIHKSLRTL